MPATSDAVLAEDQRRAEEVYDRGVGASVTGGPRVRTFDWTPGVAGGVTQLPGKVGDFFAFDPSARGGVNVG